MKVFISQPMRGKTDDEIVEERDMAYRYVMDRHGKDSTMVVESYDPGLKDEDPVYALSRSIEKLAGVDVAYFFPEWQHSRGCVVERNIAEMYHIPTCDLPEIVCDAD